MGVICAASRPAPRQSWSLLNRQAVPSFASTTPPSLPPPLLTRSHAPGPCCSTLLLLLSCMECMTSSAAVHNRSSPALSLFFSEPSIITRTRPRRSEPLSILPFFRFTQASSTRLRQQQISTLATKRSSSWIWLIQEARIGPAPGS